LIVKIGRGAMSWAIAVLLLVALVALPAAAQDSADYPPEVDGEVIDDDDEDGVVDTDDEADVGEVETVEAVEVGGVALATTGGEVLYLVLGGLLFAGVGSALLVAARRRRSVLQ
jgi:hypothetical protein